MDPRVSLIFSEMKIHCLCQEQNSDNVVNNQLSTLTELFWPTVNNIVVCLGYVTRRITSLCQERSGYLLDTLCYPVQLLSLVISLAISLGFWSSIQ
jgi:hypothetical protein